MTTSSATLDRPAESASAIRELDPAALKRLIDEGRAIVVDVREPDEHAAERIAGAMLNPLSRFDPGAVPASSEGREVVLHCRGGRRSAEAAARLIAAGHARVTHLKGGLEAWKAAGQPVERAAGRVPISIMRQVQIVVGSMVLLSSVLAWLVSPWFLVLTGFFGAGLLFAGASGTCGLALVLSRMPWNRVLCAGPAAGRETARGPGSAV